MSSCIYIAPPVLSLIRGNSVLDVGCGMGKWGFLMRLPDVHWWGGKNPEFIVGVDVFLPYLRFCKEHKIYDEIVLCDARKLPFKPMSFYTVLSAEILEHIPKSDGYAFIANLEKIAKKLIIITTPTRACSLSPQNDIDGIFQKHISDWTYRELTRLGFKVISLGIRIPIPMGRIRKVLEWFLLDRLYICPRMFNIFSRFLIAYKIK